jgi:hypothetical protein
MVLARLKANLLLRSCQAAHERAFLADDVVCCHFLVLGTACLMKDLWRERSGVTGSKGCLASKRRLWRRDMSNLKSKYCSRLSFLLNDYR